MLLTLLAALATPQAPQYNVFMGMPSDMARQVNGQVHSMQSLQAQDWKPTVEATAPIGKDTLVMWRWPMPFSAGIGLQIYGPDGKFKTRLEDSNIPSARAVVCLDRYVVGGGNTLRVWDAAQNFRLTSRKTFAELGQFSSMGCRGNLLINGQDTRLRRYLVPSLRPVDLRFGLSTATVQAVNRSTLNHLDDAHMVTQNLITPSGETLIVWARTAGYDPKGPRGVGVQIYDDKGNFKRWLGNDQLFNRDFVLCGKYLVGGEYRLNVWATAENYRLVGSRTVGDAALGELRCSGKTLTFTRSALGFTLPMLEPLR